MKKNLSLLGAKNIGDLDWEFFKYYSRLKNFIELLFSSLLILLLIFFHYHYHLFTSIIFIIYIFSFRWNVFNDLFLLWYAYMYVSCMCWWMILKHLISYSLDRWRYDNKPSLKYLWHVYKILDLNAQYELASLIYYLAYNMKNNHPLCPNICYLRPCKF